jgi:hypothetical protein
MAMRNDEWSVISMAQLHMKVKGIIEVLVRFILSSVLTAYYDRRWTLPSKRPQ